MINVMCHTVSLHLGFIRVIFPCSSPNVSQTQMDLLATFRDESLKSNQSVWFGHYTTSTVVSPSPGIREMMK